MKILIKEESGVSLIITFFITLIIIVVVLGISALLYSQIKIIRNISESVASFYLADSGAEKVLYYDRKEIPEEAVRGICNICTLGVCSDCVNCSSTGTDCANVGEKCTSCHITFKTETSNPEKYYETVIDVSTTQGQEPCPSSMGNLESKGTYINTKRAINLNITKGVGIGLGPDPNGINTSKTKFHSNGVIQIYAKVPNWEDMESIKAYIYTEDGTYLPPPVELKSENCGSANGCHATWNGEPGDYYISIGVIDASGNCVSVEVYP